MSVVFLSYISHQVFLVLPNSHLVSVIVQVDFSRFNAFWLSFLLSYDWSLTFALLIE